MRIGDIRLRETTHPDGGQTVWDVQRLTEATGPYAKKGDTYWKRITPSIEPFHVKQTAIDFMADVACYPTTGE